MVSIKPIKLFGNWSQGFALDLHTVSSEFLGYDEYGHEMFDTKRSEIGELLYKLKYGADKSGMNEILDTVVSFLRDTWKITGILDCVIPVPPSKADRDFQPVIEIAAGISLKLGIPVYKDALKKIKVTSQFKNVFEYEERLKLLSNVFTVTSALTSGKNILLFDDLYGSGATVHTITRVLCEQGKARGVYVLALTKTRSKS
ncbi:MAG: ComF family protein [Chloroflexota bacterium]|nr:ComF family protein [Chloroflexota bacterium]